MQTEIARRFHNTREGQEARDILQACVHCGFCTATCPTYLELRDERDSPRGRIYLLKQLLEGGEVTELTRTHLDRCLTCRSCETTCPSGVQYGRLLDIGKAIMEEEVERPPLAKGIRWAMRQVLPYPKRFGPLLRLGQFFRPVLPPILKDKVPARRSVPRRPAPLKKRKMLMLEGCVQPSTAPVTNAATARVLDRLGISIAPTPKAGCCGSVSHHMGQPDEANGFIKANIDAWWPEIEAGAEAIIITATGCNVTIREYGHLLADDPDYAAKARKVSEMARDLVEVLAEEDLSRLGLDSQGQRVAVHTPCTMTHGLQMPGRVQAILRDLGFSLVETTDDHLCCGSAGTYSILQHALSKKLRDNKVEALTGDRPDLIVTSNVGCQAHLEGGVKVPVKHWIELLDQH